MDIFKCTCVDQKTSLCPSKISVAADKESHRSCSIIHCLRSSSGVYAFMTSSPLSVSVLHGLTTGLIKFTNLNKDLDAYGATKISKLVHLKAFKYGTCGWVATCVLVLVVSCHSAELHDGFTWISVNLYAHFRAAFWINLATTYSWQLRLNCPFSDCLVRHGNANAKTTACRLQLS